MNEKNTIASVIQSIAILMGIAGILLVISGMSKMGSYYHESECIIFLSSGISTFVMSFFAYGFGYVVEAACKYLSSTSSKANKAEQNDNATPKKDNSMLDEDDFDNLERRLKIGAITQEEFYEKVKKLNNK